jgi:hypothetical protein
MADLGIFIKTLFSPKGVNEAKKAFGSVADSAEKMSAKQKQAAKQARDEFGRFVKQGKSDAKGLKGAFSGLSTGISKELKSLVAGFTVGAVAAGLSSVAIGSFKAAEAAKVAESAFTNLSGSANIAKINLQAMERATRGLISQTEQMKIANQLLGMNIVETDQQLEQVVSVSRRLGKEFKGLGAREAAEEFAIMIANMSVARLDSFGLSSGRVRARILELMAATEGMTREQAFFRATMEESQRTVERLGPEITTSADEVARLGAEWADFQVFLGETIEKTGAVKSFFSAIADSVKVLRDSLGDTSTGNQIDVLKLKIEKMSESLESSKEKAENSFFGFAFKPSINALTDEIAKLQFELQSQLEIQEALSQQGAEEQARLKAAIAAEEKQAAVIAENTKNREEQAKTLARVQEEFARDVIDIQEETEEALLESQSQFDDDSLKAAEDHAKRIANLRKRAAKDEEKSAKKLQRDIVKVDKNLKKSLIKQQADENKQIAKAQADFTKDDKQQRRQKQIDAAGDERLFQFELRNLAADGQGIAIKQALERRAIEQQIASEKAEFEKGVEQEKRKDTIDTMRQEGQEARTQLQQQAQERKADLEERNQEDIAARAERLQEQLAQEAESFAERKVVLATDLEERNEKIRESENERIQEISRALAETEDLTNESMDKMIALAGELGPQLGQVFADGITEAFSENLKIEDAIEKSLEGFGAGTSGLPLAAGGNGTVTPSRPGRGMQPFQSGALIERSGVGFLHAGEEVANPAEGQAITIDGETFAVRQAERMAAAINGVMQRNAQMIVDVVAANL